MFDSAMGVGFMEANSSRSADQTISRSGTNLSGASVASEVAFTVGSRAAVKREQESKGSAFSRDSSCSRVGTGRVPLPLLGCQQKKKKNEKSERLEIPRHHLATRISHPQELSEVI